MTIAQINSTKTEFTFFGNDSKPRTVFASNLINAKKNYNKRFASNDVNEILFTIGKTDYHVANINTGYVLNADGNGKGSSKHLTHISKMI